MKTVTVEYVHKCLQRECVPAPLCAGKIIRAFKHDTELLHKVLDMYAQGRLTEYHMLPGNGSMEF